MKLTPTQLDALEQCSMCEVWWHDIGAGARTAQALLRRGLIAESRAMACGTPSHAHPGYMTVTLKGRVLLRWLSR